MTQKEILIQSITWKIETATANLQESIKRIQSETDQTNIQFVNPITIQHAALDIAVYQKELTLLHEQLKMVESLTEE